jgi:hypothetical protein
MPFTFIVVMTALSIFALVPLIACLSNILDTMLFLTMLSAWEVNDKLHILWFRTKSYYDMEKLNKAIDKEEEQRQSWLTENVIYLSQPPRSNHGSLSDDRPRIVLPEQTGLQDRSDQQRYQQRQVPHFRRYFPPATINMRDT